MAKTKEGEFPPYKTVNIDELVPYARNGRTHTDEQVAQIAASIREFGFTNPVLVDADGGIIAGHGRVMAARQLGIESVPCIELDHLTEAQKRAYIIADNKLALNAGWDDEMLRVEFADLEGLGLDLELSGFSLDEVSALDPGDASSYSPFSQPLGYGDDVDKSDRQGTSPWSRVVASETRRAVIGDVEFSVSVEAAEVFETLLAAKENAKQSAREIIESAILSA